MHRPQYPRNKSGVPTGQNAVLKPVEKRKTSVPAKSQIQIPPRPPKILAVLSPILDSKTKLCYGYIITFSTLNLQLCLSQVKKKVFTEPIEDTYITKGGGIRIRVSTI
jgi:hypothetical protein